LEARKERVLDGLRNRRILVSAIFDITLAARIVSTDLPNGAERRL
jgi:hypothetical protein